MNVGTRELKNRLSYYLRRIREGGESLYVTDRGVVVAELRPVAVAKTRTTQEVLLALAAAGDVSLGSGRFSDVRPIKPRRKVSLSRYVLEDRR